MSELQMQGRVALVSGAASGMGEAVARRFLAMGASVVGFSLEKECGIDHMRLVSMLLAGQSRSLENWIL